MKHILFFISFQKPVISHLLSLVLSIDVLSLVLSIDVLSLVLSIDVLSLVLSIDVLSLVLSIDVFTGGIRKRHCAFRVGVHNGTLSQSKPRGVCALRFVSLY